MKVLQKFKTPYFILKNAALDFIDDNVLKLCASLSYYMVFSLPPLIMIVIAFGGIFFGRDAVQGQLFYEINSLVGPQVALQIQDIIKNLKLHNNNEIAIFIGGLMLFVGASGVFSEIQSSINLIWNARSTQIQKKGIVKFLKNKLLSFSMIGSVSFLLMVCLIINTLLDVLSKRLEILFTQATVSIIYIINMAIVFVVITALFALIFKTLPDKKLKWKYICVASVSNAILFMAGKYLIGLYLGNSRLMSIYGAAGTLIILLVWVYYSAIILYFGAELAKSYARINHEFDTSL